MTYYNTTHATGDLLKEYEAATETQDEKVLAFFRRNPGKRFATFGVHMWEMSNAPITSVQRSITNLTNAGYLVKTDKMVMGPYKRLVHTWKLK